MEDLKIIGLFIWGTLIIIGSIIALVWTSVAKDAPKNYGSMMRGRNPYKGSKPLVLSILGSIGTILSFCILGIPKKIAGWLPKKWKWLCIPITLIVWLVILNFFL